MLVVKVDVIDAQPPERAVAGLAHVLRPAVYASSPLTVVSRHEAELRGHPHGVTPAANRLADQLLVGERAVGVRRVEQIDSQFQGPVDRRDGLGFVGGPVGIAHAHAAESHRGDDQTLLAESFLLHVLPPGEAYSLYVIISPVSIDHVFLGLARASERAFRHLTVTF